MVDLTPEQEEQLKGRQLRTQVLTLQTVCRTPLDSARCPTLVFWGAPLRVSRLFRANYLNSFAFTNEAVKGA